jgi:(2Fe-2S) ferredoxin
MSEKPLFFNAHVFCCTNRREPGHSRGCCAEKDAEKLRDYMKQRVKDLKIPSTRINASGCLDRCELGPTMVIYPEGVWYSCKTQSDIDEVIREHLQGGRIVERLRMPTQ